MVFIPDADRGTLCVSSQVGCTLNCRFCHTGTMRLVRNLAAGEIVGQVMLARDELGEWPKGTMAGFGPDPEDEDDEEGGNYTRSEEHTSELQSLMRISYAVFCLKKKKT